MKLVLLLFLTLSASACSSLKILPQALAPSLDRTWVRSTLQKENLAFKKINRARPILVGDLVIQANGVDGVKAYNTQTASVVWEFKVKNGVEASPAIIRERLFLSSNDGNIYSIDAKSGELVWTFETKFENLGEPLIHDGVLYLITGSNLVFALDASNGKQLWVYSRQDSSNFSVRGGSRPVAYQDSVFFGFSDGAVVALGAKTGAIKWEASLNKNTRFKDIDANLVLDGDQLLVAGYDDKLYSLTPLNGEIKWRVDGGSYSGPTLFEDYILYPNSNGEVWALDRKSGQKIWTHQSKKGIPSEIQVLDQYVVYGESQGGVVLLDLKSGKFVSRYEPGHGVLSPVSLNSDTKEVYFVSGEANLYKLTLRHTPRSNWPILIR